MSPKRLSDDPRALAFGAELDKPLALSNFTFSFGERVRLGDRVLRWANENAALVRAAQANAEARGWNAQRDTRYDLVGIRIPGEEDGWPWIVELSRRERLRSVSCPWR